MSEIKLTIDGVEYNCERTFTNGIENFVCKQSKQLPIVDYPVGTKVREMWGTNMVYTKLETGRWEHGYIPMFVIDEDSIGKGKRFELIEKVEPKQKPLFTTQTGLEIYSDYKGEIWRVFTGYTSYKNWKPYNLGIPPYQIKDELYFTTEKEATEWILYNKPCLTLNDLLSVWGTDDLQSYYKESPLFKLFEKLAKSKQNS